MKEIEKKICYIYNKAKVKIVEWAEELEGDGRGLIQTRQVRDICVGGR